MTYNVFGGALNFTQLSMQLPFHMFYRWVAHGVFAADFVGLVVTLMLFLKRQVCLIVDSQAIYFPDVMSVFLVG